MKTFDTQLAMSIVSHSTGGFSYDTLARALISKDKNENPDDLLESCRNFCLSLEEKRYSEAMPKMFSFSR